MLVQCFILPPNVRAEGRCGDLFGVGRWPSERLPCLASSVRSQLSRSPAALSGEPVVVWQNRHRDRGREIEGFRIWDAARRARAVDGHMNHLQRREAMHPKELEKERAPPPVLLPKQKHLLNECSSGETRPEVDTKSSSQRGLFHTECNTAACDHNYFGSFGTPEEAAQ